MCLLLLHVNLLDRFVLTSGLSIGGATSAAAPGPRRHEAPMKEEKKNKKNSCPELPQAPFFVNETAGGGSVR